MFLQVEKHVDEKVCLMEADAVIRSLVRNIRAMTDILDLNLEARHFTGLVELNR